jgi:hypothetical protein
MSEAAAVAAAAAAAAAGINNNNTSTKISLKDVQEQTPAESEGEKRIMQDLEVTNPTGSSLAAATSQGVSFGQVPKNIEQSLKNNKSPTTGTVEDELFAFTESLNRLHDEPVAKVYTNQDKAQTQADRFAGNAGKLFQRLGKKAKQRATQSKRTLISISNSGTPEEEAVMLMEAGESRQKAAYEHVTYSIQDFRNFVTPQKNSIYTYTKSALLYLILPATGIACLLYYALDNPPLDDISENKATVSWWLLFICVRQVITFGLAKIIQFIIVDYYCLHTERAPRVLGPFVTLFMVQSKGWPFHLSAWGVWDFIMLYGSGRFARHWMFYQDYIEVFSEKNQAGKITEGDTYTGLVLFAFFTGLAVTCKRFWIGLSFGKTTFYRYGERLSLVTKDLMLVINLSKFAIKQVASEYIDLHLDQQHLGVKADYDNVDEEKVDADRPKLGLHKQDRGNRDVLSGAEKVKIADLLGEWEEVEISDNKVGDASLSAIVQFRATSSYLDNDLIFGAAFGYATTRLQMLEGAQELYARLLHKQLDRNELQFNTIAQVALRNGALDDARLKDLVRMFRPARDGVVTVLEFCKSVDSLYKELRLLRAGIDNEAKMNATSETLLNYLFYFIVGCIFLYIIGVDPAALLGALATFIIGFAFAIGSALGKWFEGMLMILLRRPYDIGDRIAVSNPDTDTSPTGSSGWIVKEVTL